MRFKVPFMRYQSNVREDTTALCWPCLTIGWFYIRFSWETLVHKTVALPLMCGTCWLSEDEIDPVKCSQSGCPFGAWLEDRE